MSGVDDRRVIPDVGASIEGDQPPSWSPEAVARQVIGRLPVRCNGH